MPADLKTLLEDAARDNNRSLTAEIIARLQGSFSPSGAIDRIAELEAITEQQAAAMTAMSARLEQSIQTLLDALGVGKGSPDHQTRDVTETPSKTVKRILRARKPASE